jgi:plasmid maintenance system antidote protein VapI
VTDPIPQHTLNAAARAMRFALLGMINKAFAHSGLTIEDLAARLGWSRNRVLRTLKGRNELTFRAASNLCWAIDGSAIQFRMEPKE